MTVFIVSLFLPYTVHFDVVPKLPPSFVAVQDRSRVSDVDYFSERPTTFYPLTLVDEQDPRRHTLGIAKEHEEFFLSNKKATTPGIQQISRDLRAVVLSDPQSPTWGRRTLTQPMARVRGAPASTLSSVVASSGQTVLMKETAVLDEKRDKSHETAMKTANWSIQSAERGNAGLQNAVSAAIGSGLLKEKTWVGTLGMPIDLLDEQRRLEIEQKLANDFDALMVSPSDGDFDGCYSNYCKTILWPVLHYQIPDHPKSKAYEDHSWVYYVKVNQLFADRIIKDWKKGDIIWIHDYHLFLVPSMLRKALPEAQIGFFLHVAFPSSEVFRCLGVRKELLEGILGANLIGLQTQEYCRHFLQTVNRLLCVETTPGGIQLEDRFINVATFPIGIDGKGLDDRKREAEVMQWLERIQTKYAGKYLIVARDKLDHIRGVRHKLLAYELFLNQNPEMANKVVLIQVATSTTDQEELDATVSHIVTRINSLHSTIEHQSVVYLKQDIAYTQYIAMLCAADVLMNTSLREGMNLTSHEFIHCQDGELGPKKYGSLILSEFTGSTAVFEGAELPVNPWDYHQCAHQIKTALTMDWRERKERWTKLYNIVKHLSAEHWAATFLSKLSAAWEEDARRDTTSIPRLNVDKLIENYNASGRRLFIIDYEGTLASYGSTTSIIFTTPQPTLEALQEITSDKKNSVYVMSTRKPEELERLFDQVPKLGLIAENGCFVRDPEQVQWHDIVDRKKLLAWKGSALEVINYYRDRIEGSWVEEKHCSIILHYDRAEDQLGASRQAGDCANHINESLEKQRVHAVPIDSYLLIEPMAYDKHTAAKYILRNLVTTAEQTRGVAPDFLMVVGDARDDEAVYQWANKLGKRRDVGYVTTVSVSSRNTQAMATLSQGVSGVVSVLQRLANSTDGKELTRHRSYSMVNRT